MSITFATLGSFVLIIIILCLTVIDLLSRLSNRDSITDNVKTNISSPPSDVKGGAKENVSTKSGKKVIYFGNNPDWKKSVYEREGWFVYENATCSIKDILEKNEEIVNSYQSMLLYCKIAYLEGDVLVFKVEDEYGKYTFKADINRLPVTDEQLGALMAHMVIFTVYIDSSYDVNIKKVRGTRFHREVV